MLPARWPELMRWWAVFGDEGSDAVVVGVLAGHDFVVDDAAGDGVAGEAGGGGVFR